MSEYPQARCFWVIFLLSSLFWLSLLGIAFLLAQLVFGIRDLFAVHIALGAAGRAVFWSFC